MSSSNKVTRAQKLTMPLVAWRMLGKYLAVVNYDRFKRGEKAVSYTQLVGGILARFLVDHAQDIERSFEEVWLSTHKENLPYFYSPDQLAAIASAARTDVPDVFRIGSRGREFAARKNAARRALCRPAQGSKSPPAGSPRLPQQVRGWSSQLVAGLSRRKT